MNNKKLTDSDITAAALDLGVDEATIRAVIEVEAAGSGFFDNDHPKILFEAHIFWRRLRAHGFYVPDYYDGNEDILSPEWNRKLYKGGLAEYDRLEKASKIHLVSALESCSWGLFQIMGLHWKDLGYQSAQDFTQKMYENERRQLDAFLQFVKVNHLVNALRNKGWDTFARGYNGPGYAQNHYDTKLAKAYKKWRGVDNGND